MSFLTGPSLPAFSQWMLSFWFRLPGSTVPAGLVGAEASYPELEDVIPLVILGGVQQQRELAYLPESPLIATGPNYDSDLSILQGEWRMSGQTTGLGAAHYLDPSYIGVDSAGRLAVNIQFSKMPQVSNYRFDPAGAASYLIPAEPPGSGLDRTFWYPTSATDVSANVLLQGAADSYYFTAPLLPTRDHWHNVLLSGNLGRVQITAIEAPDGLFNSTVQSYSKVWAVVDDVPVVISDSTTTLTGQPNDGAIISEAQWQIANTFWNDFYNVNFFNIGHDRPISDVTHAPYGTSDMIAGGYTFSPDAPSYVASPTIAAGRIGFPASSRFRKSVRHVEMAEGQMWLGSSHDVRDIGVRRLFVTDQGKPNLKAKDVAAAFGTPKILLHKSGNWIKGKNTGSAGKFTPTGKIIRYKPDPSLNGEQGDPQ